LAARKLELAYEAIENWISEVDADPDKKEALEQDY
jgi:hypothetical protein